MIEFSREGRTKGFQSGWTCLHGQTGKKDLKYGQNAHVTRYAEHIEGECGRIQKRKTHSQLNTSGGDALKGNTRSHPEHDG